MTSLVASELPQHAILLRKHAPLCGGDSEKIEETQSALGKVRGIPQSQCQSKQKLNLGSKPIEQQNRTTMGRAWQTHAWIPWTVIRASPTSLEYRARRQWFCNNSLPNRFTSPWGYTEFFSQALYGQASIYCNGFGTSCFSFY